ncbi:MAG: hypothetical protein A2509_08875 [Candidatus Edwardsbacteria bacterium RIFOXYD12_FULL_50_11]|jgi:hypothetical protein|uniref:Uncharacterized protein n=1 Tax=Candidatus Edwardsbacteria bacterium GWF2_54_11 TaxID=1817851 RepID=A0A1F5R1N0_9BACT|nr:MAG: hypothetical protein A2502_02245 [Candidatus Edwardsbacteria bacterium RifOxyC12_full_54_24]OGF08402.1 MAG: hypothetical protein A2024_06755 [Candidatus Edwardsbacteria bacterium GWF2_54_11]OGF09077.1 MAG: hypothetical protein A2273_10700 [Candidatus Edwardsbacteria bacterium RifOxyA12_full_54_48]OGF12398.1 MAG: hypothetical protein A3K15_00895 [Candidatus Edwardsbacteria bacterium GWE2_54_12]OGF17497.1 MAG: hypothetical protein A2509_08875 [Candidatus Edwardsbacteria bacterium RIFOXYD1
MQHLVVEKKQVTVTMRCRDQQVIKGDLFLSLMAKNHIGQETVLDFMNEPEEFFVLKVATAPSINIINKARIMEVSVALEVEAADLNREAMGIKEEPMTAVFNDNFKLSGKAYIDLPPEKSRTIDFLNQSERFFLLVTDHTAHIVNRRHISYVIPGR